MMTTIAAGLISNPVNTRHDGRMFLFEKKHCQKVFLPFQSLRMEAQFGYIKNVCFRAYLKSVTSSEQFNLYC